MDRAKAREKPGFYAQRKSAWPLATWAPGSHQTCAKTGTILGMKHAEKSDSPGQIGEEPEWVAQKILARPKRAQRRPAMIKLK
jgi:hypothetical protein